ncbi:MAG TPA: hydrogenase small subunit [Longimicrobiales bacterium]
MASTSQPGEAARAGIPRRDFLRIITIAAAAVGLPSSAVAEIVAAEKKGKKPSVIWLHFQECTGCTESLLRAEHPAISDLVLDLVSLDYHETLLAAAGHQAEAARKQAMAANAGKYILVIEGAIPTAENGIYCKIGGQTALELLKECAEQAGAIIAIGSCASWGGVASASPNPTGASGVKDILKGKAVVTIPGCPANPYNFLGTALQYATFGTLPALDELGRPKFAYGRTIHEDCPRRAHFDAGRFAEKFGDEGHRNGYCLYKLGCKGPVTYANCSLQPFCDVPGAWPIGIGHPCFGCTEKGVGFNLALHATVPIGNPTASTTFAAVNGGGGHAGVTAAGVGGAIVGAAIAAGFKFSRTLDAEEQASEKES